jgi:hypothetical protein
MVWRTSLPAFRGTYFVLLVGLISCPHLWVSFSSLNQPGVILSSLLPLEGVLTGDNFLSIRIYHDGKSETKKSWSNGTACNRCACFSQAEDRLAGWAYKDVHDSHDEFFIKISIHPEWVDSKSIGIADVLIIVDDECQRLADLDLLDLHESLTYVSRSDIPPQQGGGLLDKIYGVYDSMQNHYAHGDSRCFSSTEMGLCIYPGIDTIAALMTDYSSTPPPIKIEGNSWSLGSMLANEGRSLPFASLLFKRELVRPRINWGPWDSLGSPKYYNLSGCNYMPTKCGYLIWYDKDTRRRMVTSVDHLILPLIKGRRKQDIISCLQDPEFNFGSLHLK